MKALALNQITSKLEAIKVENSTLGNTQVAIKIVAASINHHELWSLNEKNLFSDSHIIMGSDGSGVIEEIGRDVTKFKIGDEVIINPSIHWGNNDKVHGEDYEILGFPTNGTFAERVVIDQEYVYNKPNHLTFYEAAALPLAGLTAYRALYTRGELEKHNKVLITGIGGGAALYVLLFAVASGAEVYVTSSNDAKIEKAIELGAKEGINYKLSDWSLQLKEQARGFDVIIDSAGGPEFSKLTELCNPGGRIALFGRTAGKITNLNPSILFWKQLSIHGTTMGNDAEFQSMLDLITSKRIKPIIDSVFAARDINQAFEKMNEGRQFGKIVIDMLDF